jgi:hypothetical protein
LARLCFLVGEQINRLQRLLVRESSGAWIRLARWEPHRVDGYEDTDSDSVYDGHRLGEVRAQGDRWNNVGGHLHINLPGEN